MWPRDHQWTRGSNLAEVFIFPTRWSVCGMLAHEMSTCPTPVQVMLQFSSSPVPKSRLIAHLHSFVLLLFFLPVDFFFLLYFIFLFFLTRPVHIWTDLNETNVLRYPAHRQTGVKTQLPSISGSGGNNVFPNLSTYLQGISLTTCNLWHFHTLFVAFMA